MTIETNKQENASGLTPGQKAEQIAKMNEALGPEKSAEDITSQHEANKVKDAEGIKKAKEGIEKSLNNGMIISVDGKFVNKDPSNMILTRSSESAKKSFGEKIRGIFGIKPKEKVAEKDLTKDFWNK